MKWAIYVAVALFIVVGFLVPVGASLVAGLHGPSLYEALAHPIYREGLMASLAIAAVTTGFALLLAVPLAWIGARRRFAGKGIAEALVLAPLILPPFVGAIGFAQAFGERGALNAALAGLGLISRDHPPDWLGAHRFVAVCALEALHLYPFLYLTVSTALARIDEGLVEAARSLGASRWRVARRIVLPLVRPGLFAGGAVVFTWSFTELGTPLMLGYDRCTPVQVFSGLTDIAQSSRVPFALVLVMLAVAAAIYGLGRGVLGRDIAHVGKGVARPVSRDTGVGGTIAAWIAYGVVVGAACVPHLAVLGIAFARDWYGSVWPQGWTTAHVSEALGHPLVVPGVLNSLEYSLAATAIGVVVGGAIAWIGVRWKPPGWRVLDAMAMLPLAVPGIVLAFGYIGLVAATPWLAALDPRRNPTILLIIAYAVRRLPHVVRSAAAGLQQAPVALEEAAAALGAGPATRLRRITLPLIAGNLAAGAVLTFSFSMLEVADSLILAQKREYYPVTRVIYELAGVVGPGPSIACAFAVWAMLFLASALIAARAFLGGKALTLMRE